jgi:hypothetical protein
MTRALSWRLLWLLSAALLGGCQEAARPLPGKPLREGAGGDLVHAASGMVFPAECAGFGRVSTHLFDLRGLEVSAGYDLVSATCPAAVTVYVYPSPAMLEVVSGEEAVAHDRDLKAQEVFRKAEADIFRAHPGARLLGESEEAPPAAGFAGRGRTARFTFVDDLGANRGPVESLLCVHCYVGGYWTVVYRATWPLGSPGEPRVREFMGRLPWTFGR